MHLESEKQLLEAIKNDIRHHAKTRKNKYVDMNDFYLSKVCSFIDIAIEYLEKVKSNGQENC